jgi:hypothetical protein
LEQKDLILGVGSKSLGFVKGHGGGEYLDYPKAEGKKGRRVNVEKDESVACTFEVGIVEVSTFEDGLTEDGMAEVGIFEIGKSEVDQ